MSEEVDTEKPKKNLPLVFKTSTGEAVPDIPVDTRSEGLKLLTTALVQIEATLRKVEEANNTLQTQLQTIQNQRIGLTAQKHMVFELKKRLEDIEATIAKTEQ